MPANLKGKSVAIVATDGFEQSELTKPLDALRAAGAKVDVIAPKDGRIQGMQHHEKGDMIAVDRMLAGSIPHSTTRWSTGRRRNPTACGPTKRRSSSSVISST